MKKWFGVPALVVGALLVLAACGGSGVSAATAASLTLSGVSGKGKTITVWDMQGDYSPTVMAAIDNQFTKETGAHVSVQLQQWTGITTKVDTALATSSPPDVLDVGNSEVASYAASGGIANITSSRKTLQQGQTWLPGLLDPALLKGQLYGVPGLGGDRAVIYNKKMWTAAGITTPPTTYSGLEADLDKVKAANPDPSFSALYLPAENSLVPLQWFFDAGGKIATQTKNGQWKGGFGTPAGIKSLEAFKQFQNAYSTKASDLVDGTTPDQDVIFANGQSSSFIGLPGDIKTILTDNPSMQSSDIGVFAMPGLHHNTQTVWLGGSDWTIPVKSPNRALALKWLKIAASPKIEMDDVYGVDGWLTNSVQGSKAAAKKVTPQLAPFFAVAANSASSPPAANWNNLEGDNSLNDFFGTIASGRQTVPQAAKAFDAHMDQVLNDNGN